MAAADPPGLKRVQTAHYIHLGSGRHIIGSDDWDRLPGVPLFMWQLATEGPDGAVEIDGAGPYDSLATASKALDADPAVGQD